MATWATPLEASTMTGSSVVQADLDRATSAIEIWTGVVADFPPTKTDGSSALKPMDLRMLKKAEAWQAAWMKRQVDLEGRSDVDAVSEDGVGFSKGNEDAHLLHPFARRAIRRLSWKRGRSLEPLTAQQALVLRGKRTPETIGLNPTDIGPYETDDEDTYRWTPL